ncbi:hypothetical protein BC939DRAFT_442373 [Gamsiella multidivaricata]|uniref:uncharacterized protein n=1 Tax=Gamsiella multidivaricata TaxID=101098 RepID=UPI00221EE90A|nr:uncharacterized protein BC939DRAFT_442373 [Gamsiella multidivaricata]KAI7828959.1 hypothetical protein BC939DRAFT_442373 [Gamsiella multidivaricata]
MTAMMVCVYLLRCWDAAVACQTNTRKGDSGAKRRGERRIDYEKKALSTVGCGVNRIRIKTAPASPGIRKEAPGWSLQEAGDRVPWC